MSSNAIRLVVLLSPLLLASCVHKYAVPPPTSGGGYLEANSVVYVATPPDGVDDQPRTYESSGSWTSSAFVRALSDRGVSASTGAPARDVRDAMEGAREAGAQFVVFPRIVHWSDRATEWSGLPDKITLQVVLSEVQTGEVRDDRRLEASSRWATLGGDHPQELLPELTSRWAEGVCQ